MVTAAGILKPAEPAGRTQLSSAQHQTRLCKGTHDSHSLEGVCSVDVWRNPACISAGPSVPHVRTPKGCEAAQACSYVPAQGGSRADADACLTAVAAPVS